MLGGFPHFIARPSHKQPKKRTLMKFDTSAVKKFVTVPALAVEWCVSEAHLYRLIQRKQLAAYKVGERIIVRRDDAKNFLESNATTASAAAA